MAKVSTTTMTLYLLVKLLLLSYLLFVSFYVRS